MTPTLLGRWQTRLFLLGTVGLIVTLLFGMFIGDTRTPLVLLGYVLGLGLVWEMLYQYLQSFRWDQDWPPAFQVGTGIFEALVVWGLVQTIGLPGVDGTALPGTTFLAHYGAVWVATFLVVQGPLRIIFLHWRYRGGQWV